MAGTYQSIDVPHLSYIRARERATCRSRFAYIVKGSRSIVSTPRRRGTLSKRTDLQSLRELHQHSCGRASYSRCALHEASVERPCVAAQGASDLTKDRWTSPQPYLTFLPDELQRRRGSNAARIPEAKAVKQNALALLGARAPLRKSRSRTE